MWGFHSVVVSLVYVFERLKICQPKKHTGRPVPCKLALIFAVDSDNAFMFCVAVVVHKRKVLRDSLLGQASMAVGRLSTCSQERPISRLENSSGVSSKLWKPDWNVWTLFSVALQLFLLFRCGSLSHRRMRNTLKDTSVACTSHSNKVCLLCCVACRKSVHITF
jgi:hypothetical protein